MAPPSDPAHSLRVVTLNCWGVTYVAKAIRKRMLAIARHLSACSYDVVCLQEVWSEGDYDAIVAILGKAMPFHHLFRSGVIGSGLCVFSRHPILEVHMRCYAVNGKPHRFKHGDWYGGKGVGCCRVDHPLGPIDFYTTHLHAEYCRSADEYLAHRTVQAFELARHFCATAGPRAIVLGDLNLEPTDLGLRVLMQHASLVDAFVERNGSVAASGGGATCDVGTNSYAKDPKSQGKRIDYVLYRPTRFLRCVECRVTLDGRIPDDAAVSFSDHYGVEAVFDLREETGSGDRSSVPPDGATLEERCVSLPEAVEVVECGIAAARAERQRFIVSAAAILLAWASLTFLAALVASGALPVGGLAHGGIGAFASHTLLSLVQAALVGGAAVCGWLGFVAGGQEIKALREAHEHMRREMARPKRRHHHKH